MSIALFPGTFDPITNGHLNLVRRISKLFSKVIVGVAQDSAKQTLFALPQRVALAKAVLGTDPKIEVVGFSGLLVTFAQQQGANMIVRGLRSVADFEYEFRLAHMNEKLAPEIEAVFLTCSPGDTFVSSSLVKEVARLGADVGAFVPPLVAHALKEAFQDGA